MSGIKTKYRRLEVTWHDSSGKTGWARPNVGYPEKTPLTCQTIGYLLRRNKSIVSLAQSIDEQGKVNDVMTIPRQCVIRVRRLVERENRRKHVRH